MRTVQGVERGPTKALKRGHLIVPNNFENQFTHARALTWNARRQCAAQ